MHSNIVTCFVASLLAGFAVLAGCGLDTPGESSRPASSAVASAASKAQAELRTSIAAAQALSIHLDGKLITRLDNSSLAERSLLRDRLPAPASNSETWLLIEARSEDGRFLRIPDPARTYADHEVLIFQSPEGWPSIGLFRHANPEPEDGDPWLQVAELSLVRCDRITVRTEELPTPATSPGATMSVIVDGQPERVLQLADLQRIPNNEQKIQTRAGARRQGRARGWRLTGIVELVVPVAVVETLTFRAGNGGAVEITGEQLRAGGAHVFRNRRGLLVLEPGQDSAFERLRGVERLEIATRE